jgi:isopropylmalate/homocitrate/citramalate synthase
LSETYYDREKRREFLTYLRKEAIELPDYEVSEVAQPRLYKEYFPWEKPPIMGIDGVLLRTALPEKIWITDTTFRDGQQAREPYTVEQIVQLYNFLHRLGGFNGKILHTEFFLYSKKDRDAIEACRSFGYQYPIVTSWIRASREDLQLVKAARIEETGILTSISDYHIFYKFQGLGRQKVIGGYLQVVEEALKSSIIPRIHLEDCTRADTFGVMVPYVTKLMKLSKKYGLPVKVRFCDTLGIGVPWDFAALPRSIPKLTWVLHNICDVPSEWIEFHGQNDFHLGVANGVAAWMYGAALNNCTLLGIGERAGNVPLEGMVFMYAALKGDLEGMDSTVITEIAKYYQREIGYTTPPYYPIVGMNFNTTWAGIHADGLLKNIEMYLPFNTETLLNNPPGVVVSEYSGEAGVAFWINRYFGLRGKEKLSKTDMGVQKIHSEVRRIYEEGRVTRMGNDEMMDLVMKHLPQLIRKYGDPFTTSRNSSNRKQNPATLG